MAVQGSGGGRRWGPRGRALAWGGLLAGGVAAPAWAAGTSAWWGVPEAASSAGARIDALFFLILVITGAVFLIVEGVLLAFLLLYRARPGRRAKFSHGNNTIEIIWTLVPAAIFVFLAVVSREVWVELRSRPPAGAMEVRVMAQQFEWHVRYPGPDGAWDTADDIETINQLHVPVRRPVLIRLTSRDVIHSLFLPQLRVKQDAVPGLVTELWVDVRRPGRFEIACAELCGLGHYRMRGFLTAESPEELAAWLVDQAEE